jgi:hypothetical protein
MKEHIKVTRRRCDHRIGNPEHERREKGKRKNIRVSLPTPRNFNTGISRIKMKSQNFSKSKNFYSQKDMMSLACGARGWRRVILIYRECRYP